MAKHTYKEIKQHNHRVTGRCKRCNKHIWLPESLAAGMGSVCRSKGIDEEISEEIRLELKKMVSQILREQKTGQPAPFRKKLHSSKSLWEKNKKLVEGW